MAITPNYSWPVPDDTDLVKDGAEAIRDLGNAIDTTVDSLPGGGLVHIEQATFSGVSGVNVNDVFSADYDNYKIYYKLTNASSTAMFFRFRVAGSDDSSANYNNQNLINGGTGFNTLRITGNTSLDIFRGSISTSDNHLFMDLVFPFSSTEKTNFVQNGFHNPNSPEIFLQYGAFNATTSFTGFSLIANTGNISGYYSVWGYKK